MIEFTPTGDELYARMERAVEKFNERLRKTVRILEDEKVPYAVVGGHAVRPWVAHLDEAAFRNLPFAILDPAHHAGRKSHHILPLATELAEDVEAVAGLRQFEHAGRKAAELHARLD